MVNFFTFTIKSWKLTEWNLAQMLGSTRNNSLILVLKFFKHFLVLWFSIFSVLWIWSTVPAGHTGQIILKKQKEHYVLKTKMSLPIILNQWNPSSRFRTLFECQDFRFLSWSYEKAWKKYPPPSESPSSIPNFEDKQNHLDKINIPAMENMF